jgi:uncharacterized protein YdbL (DUF1318 family)
MYTKRLTYLLTMLWLLTACVTINIYFPAAQAQEAAEKIVEDILSGSEGRTPQPLPATPDEQSSNALPAYAELAGRLLDLIVPPVQAAPNFSVDSPQIRKIQAALKNRHSSLKPFYNSGAIGFTRTGTVAIRDDSKVPLKQRGQLKQLIAAENQDRNALYKAIAVANGHPEWQDEVRSTFADTWIQQASPGWWYQNAKGQWVKK